MQVQIDIENLATLIQDSWALQALRAGGVDNWDWYSESLDEGGDISYEDALEYAKNHFKQIEES